jgi:putative effector of murein hydrolase
MLNNPILLLGLTLCFYLGAQWLQNKTGWVLLNPILVAIALLIIYLKSTDTVYSDYQSAGKWLDFWLKPTRSHATLDAHPTNDCDKVFAVQYPRSS